MKLLLDTCVWGRAAESLRLSGPDVIWSGDWDEDPGDEEILSLACTEGRILVTLERISESWPSSGACDTVVFSESPVSQPINKPVSSATFRHCTGRNCSQGRSSPPSLAVCGSVPPIPAPTKTI